MDNYTDGVTFIHYGNVDKHIKALRGYDWVKEIHMVALHLQPPKLLLLDQLKRASH